MPATQGVIALTLGVITKAMTSVTLVGTFFSFSILLLFFDNSLSKQILEEGFRDQNYICFLFWEGNQNSEQ